MHHAHQQLERITTNCDNWQGGVV